MKELKGIIKHLKKNNGHINREEMMNYLFEKGYEHYGIYKLENQDSWLFWKRQDTMDYTTEAICFVGHDIGCKNLSYKKIVRIQISVKRFYWGRQVTLNEGYEILWEKE